MQHAISLAEAAAMTAKFRAEKENILVSNLRNQDILTICERFERSAIDAILAQSGCVSLRIYYGMTDDLKVHAIFVGVNAANEDILQSSNFTTLSTEEEDDLAERGYRCPPYCPEDSPLNG